MAKGQLFAKKPIALIQQEFQQGQLKRALGPLNLISLGVGAIIGTGIFVLTGHAAAEFAGPAAMLSFILAGAACAFAALCYAELASTMPVAGSAYTYCYATMGEVFAWTMGWLLLLEYGVAASTVAVGWSGYVASFLKDFGIVLAPAITTSTLVIENGALVAAPQLNLIASLGVLAVTGLLIVGVHESAQFNNVIVVVKLAVLLAFIGIGVAYIKPENWTPFIPPNEGGFTYGWQGVVRAASILFFAYIGFEAVSTAAGEAKNPQKDIPIGILGSLFLCTALYIVVTAVLTGIAPYKILGVPDPIALAVDRIGLPWFAFLIKVGAIAGLTSVLLVLCYAQTRVFYQMARDGLLPNAFAHLHDVFKTPAAGTAILGCVIAVAAAVLPLSILADLVSLGTAVAFCIVCAAVLYLRKHEPDLPRPFRAPWFPFTPIMGIVLCLGFMILPIGLDIISKAIGIDLLGLIVGAPGPVKNDPVAAWILIVYAAVGAAIYMGFGYRNSRITHPGHTPAE